MVVSPIFAGSLEGFRKILGRSLRKVLKMFGLRIHPCFTPLLKGVQRPATFAIVLFLFFVNFVQSDILEAVESKLLTSPKACWSLYSL